MGNQINNIGQTLTWVREALYRLDHLELEVDDYESDFLESMLERHTLSQPMSEKQLAFLSRLVSKYCPDLAAEIRGQGRVPGVG